MTDRIVIGVDTASDRWHAMLNSGKLDPHRHEPPYKKSSKEHIDLKRVNITRSFDVFLSGVWLMHGGDHELHVFCEEPLALQNGDTTRKLGLAAGGLWAQHLRYTGPGFFWHWVNVSDWKKMVSKDKSKEAAKAWAIENLGLPDDMDEDHYDAACIGEYGRRLLESIG